MQCANYQIESRSRVIALGNNLLLSSLRLAIPLINHIFTTVSDTAKKKVGFEVEIRTTIRNLLLLLLRQLWQDSQAEKAAR